MKNVCLLLLFQLLLCVPTFAQVGINADGSLPHSSAMLDVKSTGKGILIPRMSTVERQAVANPADGLMLFDTDTYSFWYYNGAGWLEVGADLRSFRLQDGMQAEGYLLASDAGGNANWQKLNAQSLVGYAPAAMPDFSCVNVAATLGTGDNLTGVAVSGNYAYVLDSENGDLRVIDITSPGNPSFSGNLFFGDAPSALAVSAGYAYVVDTESDDLKVIDVSDPAAPALAGALDIGPMPQAVAVSGNYAYVVDEGSADLKVIDVSGPATPSLAGSLAIGAAPQAIAVSGLYAYIVDAADGDLKVIDVGDPAAPSLASSLAIGADPLAIAVSGNYAYVIEDGSGEIKTIDISNPAAPSLAGSLAIGAGLQAVAVSGDYAYATGAGSGEIKVIDVSFPPFPAFVQALAVGSPLAIDISGNYAFVVDGPGGNLLAVELSCLLPVAIDPSTGSLVEGNFQNLSVSGTALSISGGNSVSLAGVQDNLGNHTATQNIRLNNSWLSNDGGNEGVFVNAAGNVGIGTSLPGEKLHVAGNICYTGAIGACSDARYKKALQPIAGALASLRQLNGLYYYWKQEEFPDKGFSESRQIGLVAQEVEALFPEMVLTGPDGYKSVDYSRLTPVLLEAVKELAGKSESQQAEIARLQAELSKMNELEQRLARLEAIILNQETIEAKASD